MEIMGRVSKGSVMDQIYLPKQRGGFPVGSYVVVSSAVNEQSRFEPVFYRIRNIEPIKMEIVKRVFSLIENLVECSNIIITGSFVRKGFLFRDMDILIISDEKKIDEKRIAAQIKQDIGIFTHLICLSDKELSRGVTQDPLYSLMINRCVSKKRLVHHLQKRIIKPQLLDVHLLKSKFVFYSFDLMSGDDVYYAVRNMVAISLFLKKVYSIDKVESEIEHIFGISEGEIRRKVLNKTDFLKKYKQFYQETFKHILVLAHDEKQKQAP